MPRLKLIVAFAGSLLKREFRRDNGPKLGAFLIFPIEENDRRV